MQIIYIIKKTIIILLTFVGLSCNQMAGPTQDFDLKYIRIMRSGVMDTIYRRLEHWDRRDSLITMVYSEKTDGDEDDHRMTYKLSKGLRIDSSFQARLLEAKTFEFEGKDYSIRKYLYDNPDWDDEEMLYFYSPDFGILVFKSAWWGNYDRLLITPNQERNRIIFYLIEMIATSDKDFFVKW